MPARTLVDDALRDAEPRPLWTHQGGAPEVEGALVGRAACDLLVVGGGLTGLWAAIQAADDDPGRSIVLVESRRIAFGASGRNGGFISESLTHGLGHGRALWPEEMPTLLRLGRENLQQIADFLAAEGIEADLRRCGKTLLATRPHHLPEIAASFELHRAYCEDVSLLSREQAQADVHSPTYLGGLRVRSGGGLVDPARLAWGLLAAARRRGVTVYEDSPVTGLRASGAQVEATTPSGSVCARQVVLATNAYRPLLRRLRHRILPIYDHVLASEPLHPEQLDAIGWRENQGLTDAGNQFHYYRRTADDRIVWGGYDAVYYFGSRTDPALEQRDRSHRLLVQHFFATFPQLAGLRFTHRWAGLIDSTSRFTPVFGTALGGRMAYALGYTGLGVGSSRFGARVALDLLSGRPSEVTALQMVRRRGVPFPPEPLRYPVVQFTRSRLARQDVDGRRGWWLSALDRFGVGFDS